MTELQEKKVRRSLLLAGAVPGHPDDGRLHRRAGGHPARHDDHLHRGRERGGGDHPRRHSRRGAAAQGAGVPGRLREGRRAARLGRLRQLGLQLHQRRDRREDARLLHDQRYAGARDREGRQQHRDRGVHQHLGADGVACAAAEGRGHPVLGLEEQVLPRGHALRRGADGETAGDGPVPDGVRFGSCLDGPLEPGRRRCAGLRREGRSAPPSEEAGAGRRDPVLVRVRPGEGRAGVRRARDQGGRAR